MIYTIIDMKFALSSQPFYCILLQMSFASQDDIKYNISFEMYWKLHEKCMQAKKMKRYACQLLNNVRALIK